MKYIYIFFFLFIPLKSFSQQSIKGTLDGEDGKPIINANIILYGLNSNDILAYTSSSQTGNFEFSMKVSTDSLRLEISCIGYVKTKRTISAKNTYVNFTIPFAKNELKEIVVSKVPIRLKGDTINYDADSFTDRGDRVIIDVLKKLPGISVSPDGQILFNNKAINKFYVEGKDLLENQYNIATNNLPSDAVEQIQVLQKHQPIKLLEGIDVSDRAAINIRLKKNAKIRLLGNGYLGAAAEPLSSNNGLSMLKFSKDLQYISSLKHNSLGENLDKELTDQNVSASMYESGSIQHDQLSLVKAAKPPVDPFRYWLNNNFLSTGNLLLNLKKSFEIKFNVAYERDQLRDSANSIVKNYLPNDTITILENHKGVHTYSKLITGAVLQLNTKNIFFKNNFRFRRNWSIGSDIISSSGVKQVLNNPFINLINELSGMVNIKNMIYGISSFSSYSNQPQSLSVNPGQFIEELNNGLPYRMANQRLQLKSFYTDNSVSFGKGTGRFKINSKLGLTIHHQMLSNELSIDSGSGLNQLSDQYSNDINRSRLKLYGQSTLGYAREKINLTLGVMPELNHLESSSVTLNEKSDRLFINPNFSVLYDISAFWNSNLSLSVRNDIGYERNPTFILNDYRTLASSDIPLREINIRSISYNIGYKNVISGIFSNLGITYSVNKSNILVSNSYEGIRLVSTAIEKENPYLNFNLAWNVSKYWHQIKTNLNVGLKYNTMEQNLLQQGQDSKFKSHIYSFSSVITSDPNKKMMLQHDFNLSVSKNQNQIAAVIQKLPQVNFFRQSLSAKLYLPKQIEFRIKLEQYGNNFVGRKISTYHFFDALVQKSLLKPKMDFSIGALNIANIKSYRSYAYENNILTDSEYILRGRMIQFKVAFQL